MSPVRRVSVSFDGFDPARVQQLAELPGYDPERYRAASDALTRGVREPAAALVEHLAAAFEPALTVVRRSSVSPLHTDLRFAKPGAARYKDHLLLTAWHGRDKKFAPTLWLRIDAESVGFASGMMFTPAARRRFRAAVAGDSGKVLSAALAKLEKRHQRHAFELAGERLKKVPKPWTEDHARAELLRLNGLQVRFRESLPKNVGTAAFAAWCEKRWREVWPVHTWLVEEVARDEQ